MYHEKQVRQMCLVHALNNLVQEKHFTSADIDSICYDLNESRWLNPHRSMLGVGNYDVNVLMVALERLGFKMQWFDTRLDASRIAWPLVHALIFNVPSPSFIPFYRGRHWYTVLKHEDRFVNLDSKLAAPVNVDDILGYTKTTLREKDNCQVMIISKSEEPLILP